MDHSAASAEPVPTAEEGQPPAAAAKPPLDLQVEPAPAAAPAAAAPEPAVDDHRAVTLVSSAVVVGSLRDWIEYTFEITNLKSGTPRDRRGTETFTTRFSHAKKVHSLLYEVGSLDRLADSGLGFPSNFRDSMRDMTHDEANVARRGKELLDYYQKLFAHHGAAIGHRAFLPKFREAMDLSKISKTFVYCGSGFFGVVPGSAEKVTDDGAIHGFLLEQADGVTPVLTPLPCPGAMIFGLFWTGFWAFLGLSD